MADNQDQPNDLPPDPKIQNRWDFFVSGWRPVIAWVCAIAIAYQFLIRPLLIFGLGCFGVHVPLPPGLDDSLWQLVGAVLGLGGLHSFDKMRGL